MRDIRIRPILNGWIVKAGCQELCFTDAVTLGTELTRYLWNPQKVENEYLSNAVNPGVETAATEPDGPSTCPPSMFDNAVMVGTER